MTHPGGCPVEIGLRLYRALANAFPAEFKNAYGDELVQVTEDAIDGIWRQHGVPGLVRLLLDIAFRVPAEHVAELHRDVRYALRTLALSPGFTMVALVSLSLGIAIATGAYSEMNGLLRDLPGVPKPGEMVALQAPSSYPAYERYQTLNDLFSATFAYVAPVPFEVSRGSHTERFWGHLVTSTYFSTLGVRPVLGRFLGAADAQPGRPPAAVISYRFWQEHMAGDPSVLGTTLRVNGYPTTVIGVGPREFLGASPALYAADLWLPVSVDPRLAPELAGHALERRDLTMFQVAGRLRPGVTEAAAEERLDATARQFAQSYGEDHKNQKGRRVLLLAGGKVMPVRKQDMPFFKEFLMVLGGLVLLIACFNVANMMLARAAERRREIAVRLALGASRSRLIRQLLTESLLIAAGAAVPGFLLCVWLMRLLSQLRMPFPIPISLDLNPDWRALLFTLAIAGATGVAFGLAPALQATRPGLVTALKEGGATPLQKNRRFGLRHALVLCQMAASLTLLLLTGYMGFGIQSTLGMQEGFNAANLYLLSLDPVRDGYSPERAAAFFHQLRERLKNLPSVTASCLTDTVPVAMDGNSGVNFSTPGEAGVDTQIHWGRRHIVGKDYFETVGIPVRLGRSFREQDEADGATAVIVSQELVRAYWQEQPVLGRRIEVANDKAAGNFGVMPGTVDFRSQALGQQRRTYEVVGVAGDVAEDLVASKKHPAIYFPMHASDYAQPSLRGVTVVVRAVSGVDAIAAVRREISAIDPAITPFNARSMTEQIAQFMSALEGASWTYALIGAFGLILAAVGLAGVTAYSVTQRRHEIGIRVALGAQKRDVLGLVMKEGALLVIAGTCIGLAFAWAGVRAMSGLFFSVASVQGADPLLLIGAPALLATLAMLACYLPARKSMRIDPAVALRQE